MQAPSVTTLSRQAWRAIFGLGITQIVGWGSTYYLMSLMGSRIGNDLGLSNGMLMAGVSLTLGCAAIIGPFVGRWQDRAGSRVVMTTGSLIMAVGLVLLSQAQSWFMFYASWIVIGIGSPMALYSASFTALTQIAGKGSRRAISYLTFMGGLASTISWPLTAWLMTFMEWRSIVLLFAGLNFLLCAPLHFTCLTRAIIDLSTADESTIVQPGIPPQAQPTAFIILSAMLTLTGAIVNSWSLLVFPVLMGIGFEAGMAIFVGSVVGIWQVFGRVCEMLLARRLSIFWTGMVAIGFLPIAFSVLLNAGGNVLIGSVFAAFYGISNGLITIARGGMILAIFGAHGYGEKFNRITVAQNMAGATAPIAGGYLLDWFGAPFVLDVLLAFAIAAFLLMLTLRRHCARNGLS